MTFLSIFFNKLFIPLFTFAFMLFGVLAAVISAVIEYCVFQGLFHSSYQTLIPSESLAFILVVILEGSKLYLHFLRGQNRKLNNTLPIPAWTTSVSIALTVTSLCCTIIFTLTTFHLASYDPEKINEQITNINITLNQDIEDMKKEHYAIYEENVAPYRQAMENADEAFLTFSSKGISYNKSKLMLESLGAIRDSTLQEYNTKNAEYLTKYYQDIAEGEKALRRAAQEEIDKLSDLTSDEVAAQYDNVIISHFLTIISQTFFDKATYTRESYLWFSLLFGTAISILLELLIQLGFLIPSLPLSDLTDSVEFPSKKLEHLCNEALITGMKTLSAMTVYIIVVSLVADSVPRKDLLLAATACFTALTLVKRFFAVAITVPEKPDAFSSELLQRVKESILEGIVAFMGYVLLGFVLGKQALHLDISTIAIGIGTSAASLLATVPEQIFRSLHTHTA